MHGFTMDCIHLLYQAAVPAFGTGSKKASTQHCNSYHLDCFSDRQNAVVLRLLYTSSAKQFMDRFRQQEVNVLAWFGNYLTVYNELATG